MMIEEERLATAAANLSPLVAIRADLRRCLRAATAELRRAQTRERSRRYRQRRRRQSAERSTPCDTPEGVAS